MPGKNAPGTRDPITVLDVGGTYLRSAKWTPETGVTISTHIRSPSFSNSPECSASELQGRLIEKMSDTVPNNSVAGVSFGAALDHKNGTVYASAPLWGAHAQPFDLLGRLRAVRPDVRWHVVNDVTAALLDIASSARCREHRKVFLATISTGIACRVLDRRSGEIPVDGCGLQGEVGHLPGTVLLDDQPVELHCDCGEIGHVAAYSSGPGIRRLTEWFRHRRPEQWRNSVLADELDTGVEFESAWPKALDAEDQLAHDLLAAATAPVADIVRTTLCLDPEIDLIAFTGGVAVGLGDRYRQALLAHLTQRGLYLTSDRMPEWVSERIVVCEPGEADCLAGAGFAAFSTEDTGKVVSR